MKASSAFPSEYLKAADLNGKNIRAVISHYQMKDVGDDHKPVLYFQGKDKGLVLNKTNANNIAAVYGDEMDDWQGKEIILFEALVEYQGKTMPAIRVRSPQPKDSPAPSQNKPPMRSNAGNVPDDDISF